MNTCPALIGIMKMSYTCQADEIRGAASACLILAQTVRTHHVKTVRNGLTDGRRAIFPKLLKDSKPGKCKRNCLRHGLMPMRDIR